MNESTARALLEGYLSIDREIMNQARLVRAQPGISDDEQRKHLRLIGATAMSIRDALDVIVREHPSLRPAGMSPP